MKRIFLFLAVAAMATFSSCQGDDGAPGPAGPDSEVYEVRNENFTLDIHNEYTIYEKLNPNISISDNILIYRLSGTLDSQTPIWQLIPRTFYLSQGELDYDFDFTKEDFTIYANGTYDLSTTPAYLNNQTFRLVIIPGYFSNKSAAPVDLKDYNAVVKYYHIDDSKIKVLNK